MMRSFGPTRIPTMMAMLNRHPRRWVATLVMPILLFIASCGGGEDDGIPRFPVSGTVKVNGVPLANGTIGFLTDNPNDPIVSGPIKEGSYTISAGGVVDGARAGKYKVTIRENANIYEIATAEYVKKTGTELTGPIPDEYVNKANKSFKSIVPAGYGDPRTTPLTAEVKPEPNTISFDLTDANPPPNPTRKKESGKGRKGL